MPSPFKAGEIREREEGLKRALYDGIDHLLAPETLRDFTGDNVSSVQRIPMISGYSGSRQLAVEAKGDKALRFVLKCMGMRTDWLIRSRWVLLDRHLDQQHQSSQQHQHAKGQDRRIDHLPLELAANAAKEQNHSKDDR